MPVGELCAASSPTRATCSHGRRRTAMSRAARRPSRTSGSARSRLGSSVGDGISMPTRDAAFASVVAKPHGSGVAGRANARREERVAASRSPVSAAASAASDAGAPRPEPQARLLESPQRALTDVPRFGRLPRGEEDAALCDLEPGAPELGSGLLGSAQHGCRLVQLASRDERFDRERSRLPEDQERVVARGSATELDGLVDAPERKRDAQPRGRVVDDVLELVPRRRRRKLGRGLEGAPELEQRLGGCQL